MSFTVALRNISLNNDAPPEETAESSYEAGEPTLESPDMISKSKFGDFNSLDKITNDNELRIIKQAVTHEMIVESI